MRAPLHIAAGLSVCVVTASCSVPSAKLKIPERPLPATFERAGSDQSIANLSWRTYFADEPLNALIASALAANHDVFIALQRIELARAGVQYRTGASLPRVALNAAVGIAKFARYTAEGSGAASTEIRAGQITPTPLGDFSVGLQASWEIDAWGKLKNERQAAVARYLASLEGLHLVLASLVGDVASAYFELIALDNSRDILTQAVLRRTEALDVVRIQKEAGRANELAVQQFAAQLADIRALEAETVSRIRETENAINLLRGNPTLPIVRSKQALLRGVAKRVAAGVPAALLRNRPDVRQAEQQVRAAKCDLRAARAAFFPHIEIAVGVGYRAFDPRYLLSTPASLAYAATAGLVAPLVNRSAIEADFAAAKASQIEAMYAYQKVVLSAYTEVVNGLERLSSASKIVALKTEQKRAVEQTVGTADTLYRAGKATYVEVLLAQQNTLSAELELIDALRRGQLASVAIYKALGGGWQ